MKNRTKKKSPSFERRQTAPRMMANQRTLVAQHAARIMHEHGVHDYLMAKRKAAERLGIDDRAALPSNSEIEEALAEHQRLFAGPEHGELLKQLRHTSLRAMDLFEEFEPRLVGSVLSGTASEHSDVNLHLFADAPEQVAFRLMRDDIPYRWSERRIRSVRIAISSIRCTSSRPAKWPIDATVFPLDGAASGAVRPDRRQADPARAARRGRRLTRGRRQALRRSRTRSAQDESQVGLAPLRPYLRRKRLTRPAVSIIFCWPVKNG